MLQNEKYAGDVLLQKTYTADFLEKKVKKNRGEVKQYYITDNHPAIIPRDIFQEVQLEIARRSSKRKGFLPEDKVWSRKIYQQICTIGKNRLWGMWCYVS